MQALLASASLIARNAGMEGDVVIERILNYDWAMGYNAMSTKYENLLESGVIDPSKVTKCALQNAASIDSNKLRRLDWLVGVGTCLVVVPDL